MTPPRLPAPPAQPWGGAGPYCADCGHTTRHSAVDCPHQACAACRSGRPVRTVPGGREASVG